MHLGTFYYPNLQCLDLRNVTECNMNSTECTRNRVGNRSGQSDFPTRVQLRFPVPGRVRTLRYIPRPDPNRDRSLVFQFSVGPVYFKDLLGKSWVGIGLK